MKVSISLAAVGSLNMKFAIFVITACFVAQINAMTFHCASYNGKYCAGCCSGNLGGNNNVQFGNVQGCTRDGKYCAHVTEIDNASWKLWVSNNGAGCGCSFRMKDTWDANGKIFWNSDVNNCC